MRLSMKAVLIAGTLLFFGHNLLNYVTLPKTVLVTILMNMFFTARGAVIPLNSSHLILDLYAVLPWTGVMLLGYCLGYWYRPDFSSAKRKKLLLVSGLSASALFFVLRLINKYGDPFPWMVNRDCHF